MTFDIDPHPVQHGQPDVAERGILWKNQMLAELEVGSTAGEDGGAIGQVMDGADVRTESHGSVVKQAGTISFFGGLELVDQAGKEFAVNLVALLGGFHTLTG